MKYCNEIKQVLFSSEQIRERVCRMAEQISADYKGKRPLVIGVLKGAWVFVADLLREMDIPADVDFICASSYGSGTTTSGTVTLLKDITLDCRKRDVLIVEDIIDSGVTLSLLKQMMLDRKAKSVNIVTLLSKPSRRKADVDVKYVGFEIPDEFVVGYGMDYDERFRTFADIGILKEEVYK